MPDGFVTGVDKLLPGPPISNDEVMGRGLLLPAVGHLFGTTLRVDP